jgi:hypothetical protein
MSQLIDKLKKLGASSLEIEAIIYSDDINKSLSEFYKKSLEEDLFKAKAAVGEIREWKGIKYQKQSDGSWKPLTKVKEGSLMRYDKNYFGRNYFRYRGKPKEAVEFLSNEKKGQVKSVWNRKDLGSIDLVYGNVNFGLAHIIEKHVGKDEDNCLEKDFKNNEELGEELEKILKEGKILRSYIDKKGYSKKDISLDKHKIVVVESFVYDEEDNFRDKRWIITSYDPTRTTKEKGIEKAISEENCLTKESNCINSQQFLCHSRKNDLGEEQPSSVAYHPTALSFSECKDTLKKSLEQQLMRAFLNKRIIF